MTTEATAFNTPFEAGIRSVMLLLEAHPRRYDLQRLVTFDHVIVHTGDVGGPASLHPRLPLRTAEVLVRRGLVEHGLLLMCSRGLVERGADESGIVYWAGELAAPFVQNLTSAYSGALRGRAHWVVDRFGDDDDEALRSTMNQLLGNWMQEFRSVEASLEMTT